MSKKEEGSPIQLLQFLAYRHEDDRRRSSSFTMNLIV